MYTNEELQIIRDNQPYENSQGKYPSNFPKSLIPDIFPVVEVEKPVLTPPYILTGFHIELIDGVYKQVWDYREKTPEEIKGELKNKALIALNESDMVALRCFKAGVNFNMDWQAYVINLRAVYNGFSDTIPVKPDYPQGS